MGFKLSHSLWSPGYYNRHYSSSGKGNRVEGNLYMPCVAYSCCEFWLGLAAVGKREEMCLDAVHAGTPDPARMDSEL